MEKLENLKKVKSWVKGQCSNFMNKIRNNEGTRTRFLFGMNAKEKVMSFFVLLFLGVFTSCLLIRLGVNSKNPLFWAVGLFLVISKMFIISGIFNVVKLRSGDPNIKEAILSLVFADIFVFLYFSPLKSYFGDLFHFNLNSIFEVIPPEISAVVVHFLLIALGFIWYKKASKTEMEEIYGRTDRMNWFRIVIFSSITAALMVFFMILIPDTGAEVIFKVRDAFIIYFLLIVILSSYELGVKLWETTTDITQKGSPIKDIPNGKRVYFIGDYSRLDIRTDVKRIFGGYNHEERKLFYEVSVGKNEYLVYGGHKLKKIVSSFNPRIFHGAKLEVWGIVIKIRKQGENLDYIVPYRINVLGYPQLKKKIK